MQKKTHTVCVFCGSKSGNNIKYLKLANIVNYFEAYEDKRFLYLCTELCTGGELFERVTEMKDEFDEEKVLLQFGRYNNTHFNMDVAYPFSLF